MRVPAVLLLLLPLAGCVSDGVAPASQDERTVASNAVFVCLEKAVAKVDDFHSDAGTIAEAAAGMCESQFAVMDDSYFRQENAATRRILARTSVETHLKIALRAVLAYRNRTGMQR